VAGLLYIVATPIGNLEDITLRALRALKEADLIAAEDTRHTKILLAHYDIRTPLASYHEHNEKTKAATLVEQLMAGKTIALVSDAGTPTISDPGYRVIAAAVAAGIKVVPVPGAAAFVAALSASGLPTDRFVFEGFLSNKKKQRRACLRALVNETRTLIFYEAPHRLNESLGDIYELLGDREIVIAREVSKIHEEFLRGGVSELIAKLADQEVRGEITLIIKGTTGAAAVSDETIKTEIGQLKADGLRVKEIADILGEKYALAKRDIYRMAFDRQGWESKR
jgi:16S rRNA (cytidine1402-2'-O)-methyltransferase